ncbi:B-cell receptor CD22 [Oreochromis niloticus]|uniref:B-cell receptor CD22 n=1 Tax=Oreochromis niloticus TaxID=8128 RepID=UPI000DF1D45F|nr:B-cell receptor CD22-like [Oreochromis niloticus]
MATLTADSTTIPAGGSVTLTCDVKESAALKYEWFRQTSSEEKSIITDESGRVISVSEGGNYTCRAEGKNIIMTESDSVTIQETVRSSITVKLQHSWSQIFTSETITLRCEIQGGEGKVWKYEWTAPNTNSPPTSSEYRISRVSVSHSGDYRCRGSSDYLLTGWSDAFRLTVSSSKPRATLTAHSSVIPAGGSVTLSCSVEGSAGWKFDWFRRDSEFSGAQKIGAGTSEHTISISEGGIYYCRGGRGDPVFSTEDSAPVTIQKQVLAAVKLQHSWSQIFTGETITLRCEIQGGEGKVWKYEWTAPNTNSPPTSSEYRISRVSVSHSGDYRCRGSSDYLLTGWSDAFRLTVSYKPRATLTAGTTIIPVGGSVTLTCSVQSSDGWKYQWFRRTQRYYEVQARDQQNRVIRVSQGGIYSCRGTRGNPVYYTLISDDVTIWITFSNKVVVKQQPNWPQIFRGETITLTCEVQEGGETTEWEYEWRGPRTPTQWTHNNDVTFRVSESSSGDYMCKSRRRDDSYSSTEWSEAFTLSASNKPKAKLRADNTAVPVGGSVTLTCSVNPSSSSGWKYYWYRDEKSSEALTTQDAVFHSNGQISVSQEGLYRCRGGRGNPVYYTEDSQEVQINTTVTVSGADSSSSPVWLIVGLVCGVSLIIILLLLLYRCRQSKYSCFTRWIQSESHSPGSSTNHGVNQNETHEYNSLHPGADEPQDVTYSLITLHNFGKKRKHHKPEQSAVYSEVKTGAAEDSLMYAEVKQPKKEKAKKNKGKSSPAADAAVYSEVTSGSSLSQ